MSLVNKIEIPCRKCNAVSCVKTHSSINVTLNPELKEKVLNGSAFLWECPECGTGNLISLPCLYHDTNKKLMIYYLPRGMKTPENDSETAKEKLNEYTTRRTCDLSTLIEKVSIFEAGLDDIAMEMCKYITKLEIIEKHGNQAAEILNAPFKFHKVRGADSEIELIFPANEKFNIITIGFNLYEDCLRIMQHNDELATKGIFPIVDEDHVTSCLG